MTACSEETNCDLDNDGTIQPQEKIVCEKENTKNQRQQLSENTTPLPINTSEESTKITTAFVAVHMESGSNAKTTEEPEKYWIDLENLIATADEYNVKLTLLFNPQWATYILEDNTRLEQVNTWETNGHEIGVHHHGPGYGNTWNGYTNQEEYLSNPEYLGTMSEMMELLDQISLTGKIYTGGISTDTDAIYDMPEEIMYETNGAEASGLLSTPQKVTYGDHTVLQVTHALYTVGKDTLTFETIKESLTTAQEGQLMGIVFHVQNFKEKPDEVKELFQLFNDNNVEVKSVKDILDNYN
jgi:hypothetical protein